MFGAWIGQQAVFREQPTTRRRARPFSGIDCRERDADGIRTYMSAWTPLYDTDRGGYRAWAGGRDSGVATFKHSRMTSRHVTLTATATSSADEEFGFVLVRPRLHERGV